ncbi:hypothetical protein [Hymenobacter lucidus]|uniref:Uncharacterized protein n=1 Tax=Hymenobacter lucidus TaxID=2880930 RepID=A0ABS8AP34_9BACT|nr:hypothetical protein [Hymenobacter lucidus]MCB2407531.1 hypothetical protein [Hymenobacter lucidus]
MKHVSGLLQKLTAFAAVVVALSSCNRAEYAMLPKTSSYHGAEHRSVSVKPASVATPTPEAVAAPEAVAVAPKAEAAPAAVAAPKAVAAAPAASKATVAAAPAQAEAAQGPVAPAKAKRKLNVLERAMVAKVVKKADKLSNKMQLNKHSEAASANKLQGKLRQGIILVLIGILVEILGAALSSGIIYLLGALLILVGLVLIVLYLLDEI